MELFDEDKFEEYIRRNFKSILEISSADYSSEGAGTCDVCQREAFLKIHSRSFTKGLYDKEIPRFVVFFIECPKCRSKSFINTIQLTTTRLVKDEEGDTSNENRFQFYQLYRLPTSEESFVNNDIPEEYVSLKDTVSEAVFCLLHGRNIAAAILFRRAIQILTKDVLGAKGDSLYKQLEWLKVNTNNLGITLIDVFHDNAKIIKDIGNQGAHPDNDVTLHNFTKEDADGLHDLFLSIIHEVFVKPAKLKALQDDLRKSRKLQ